MSVFVAYFNKEGTCSILGVYKSKADAIEKIESAAFQYAEAVGLTDNVSTCGDMIGVDTFTWVVEEHIIIGE